MARTKIEQPKYKCADCEHCIPYEKEFLSYEGKPILAGCDMRENDTELFLLNRSVNCENFKPKNK